MELTKTNMKNEYIYTTKMLHGLAALMGIYRSCHPPMLPSNCCYDVFFVMVNNLPLSLMQMERTRRCLARLSRRVFDISVLRLSSAWNHFCPRRPLICIEPHRHRPILWSTSV